VSRPARSRSPPNIDALLGPSAARRPEGRVHALHRHEPPGRPVPARRLRRERRRKRRAEPFRTARSRTGAPVPSGASLHR
jgi:hypothetical protein